MRSIGLGTEKSKKKIQALGLEGGERLTEALMCIYAQPMDTEGSVGINGGEGGRGRL